MSKQVKKRNYSAEDIFREAAGWEYSSQLLYKDFSCRIKKYEKIFKKDHPKLSSKTVIDMNNYNFTLPTFSSSLTSSTFCLELYLKALILIETGVKKQVHDLVELYNEVGDKNKKKIDAQFLNEIKSNNQENGNKDALSGLIGARDAFVECRYLYEGLNPKFNHNISQIIWSIRKLILELEPEWIKLVDPSIRN